MKLLFVLFLIFPLSSEGQDIIKLYQGEVAPFSGALLPFQTLKKYQEYGTEYEMFKKDYIDYGAMEKPDSATEGDKIALQIVMIIGAGLIGAGLTSDSSVRGPLIAVGVGAVTYSFLTLTF